MRKVWLISFTIMMMVVTLALPAGAAVPTNKYCNKNWFWNLFNRAAITQPTVPSIPKETKPVTTDPGNATAPKTGDVATPAPGNADKNAPAQNLTEDENYILQQVNAERAKAGLGPLQIDYRLVQTARAKSQDMIDNRYFDHQSPVLGSPFDQMKRAGISYHFAGENIAEMATAAQAMEGWMNSPGHRANILNPNFTHIGIGVIKGGPAGEMLTQQFIGL